MDKTYRNNSEEVLESRNPRLAIKPGDKVTLNLDNINHSVRAWIRTGILVLDEADAPAAKAPAKSAAKKPAPKKTAAKKLAAKAKT